MVAECDAFIPKPICAERLLAVIQDFLGLEWRYAEISRDTVSAVAEANGVGEQPAALDLAREEAEALYQLALAGNGRGFRGIWRRCLRRGRACRSGSSGSRPWRGSFRWMRSGNW